MSYHGRMSCLNVALSTILLFSSAQAKSDPAERKLEGNWKAVKIIDSKRSANENANTNKSALEWNYIHLLPNHKFQALFTIPLNGTWLVKGSLVKLKPSMLMDTSSKGKHTSEFSFTPDPVTFQLDKNGKTLTGKMGEKTFVFQRSES